MSQKRENTTVLQPTTSTKRVKPLSFERKPDGKIFFSRSTAVTEIRDIVRLHNRVLLVSPPMTGKSTLLQMFKEDKTFDSVFHFDFKGVWADGYYGLRDEFRKIVAWELHQRSSFSFSSTFELVREAKIKTNTLILIDEYEKPFLAHYSNLYDEDKSSLGAATYLREIRTFYDCLCTMSEVYILMVGFTDLAVRELDERYFQVFTFHSDDKLRNWFGVEKAEISALPIDAEIKKGILSACEEKFTFYRDDSFSYYLIDGVESLLCKYGIVPGSQRSKKLRCSDSFWEYVFETKSATSLFKIFIVEKKILKVSKNILDVNFKIQDLYCANSFEALLSLLIRSGNLLYQPNGTVSSSHIIPDDTRARLIREYFSNVITKE